MGGPIIKIIKKKGEHGRHKSKDMRETLGFLLCCAIKCSQPAAMH